MLMRVTVASEEALWASGPSAGKPFRWPLSPGNPLRFPPPRTPHPISHARGWTQRLCYPETTREEMGV